MPKISVIMLTYNREKLLGRAIESILSQTFRPFEFIIVDNGSTDNCGEICEKYAAKDSRIKVIHRMRGSIGSGRNSGLNIATGDYITFVDDDDYFMPDMLDFLYQMVDKFDADISVCGSFKEENGELIPNIVYGNRFEMDATQATEVYLLRKLYNAGMPTKLIRRTLFDKIRFFETGTYEDIRVTYRYFANANRVVAHGIPKYCAYRHPGNNSSTATNFKLLNSAQLNEYLGAFRERTEYISYVLPHLTDFARYSEWSYMVSMCEKIIRYGLTNCDKPLFFMKNELERHYDEFLYGPYIQDYEKVWLSELLRR